MQAMLTRSMSEPAHEPHTQPTGEAEVVAAFAAALDAGRVNELVALLATWTEAEQGPAVSERTMAELYFAIAAKSSGARARELARTALDWFPAHLEALSLFEKLIDVSWADELCARYQTFLEDAPLHDVPPAAQNAIREKLIRAERAAF